MPEAVLETPPVTPPATAPATVPDTPPAPPATPQATTPPASEPPATPPTAPVQYELTLPEGSLLDDSHREHVIKLATARGLSNEDAQIALSGLDEQARMWKSELDVHPEIGGAKFPMAEEHAMRFLDRVVPASTAEGARLREDMKLQGARFYAPLMLALSRAGKMMAEDRPGGMGTATTTPAAPKSMVNQLYSKTTPEPE